MLPPSVIAFFISYALCGSIAHALTTIFQICPIYSSSLWTQINSYFNCLGSRPDRYPYPRQSNQLCLALCSVPRWHILRHHLVLRSNVHVCEVRLGKLGPCGLILQNLPTVCWTQLNVVLQTKTNRKKNTNTNINTSWDLAVLPQNLPYCWTQLNENFRKYILCIVHLAPHKSLTLTEVGYQYVNFHDFN